MGKTEEKLQEQTAVTAFQLVWGSIKGLGNLVVDENAVQRGMKEYARKFLERYGDVKVLNMAQPVPLRDIYVAAQVLSPRMVKSHSSVDELHELFLQRGRRHLFLDDRREHRQDCLELANHTQYLNILGAPGGGKSTFLRRLGLEALQPRRAWNDSVLKSLGLRAGLEDSERSRYEHDCLPVLIELRRFRTDEVDLFKLVRHELATCGLPESETLVEALLKGGRLLLLLDGVDEVPGDRLDKAITHICDFVNRYSSNRFVISCRTAFYRDYFSRFSDVLLADFDDKQIASFVQNWFRSDHDFQRGTGAEFLKILGEPANASAMELASTPLLLTFLCLTYDDRQRLPPNRSELYRQALEILMERWAASKRVHNEPIYRELHARLEVQMLAEIAAPAFRDSRYFFTRRELIDRITAFLRDELNAPKHLDGDQVLNAIEIQQGLVVQRAQDAWSFTHLTLQEYLTAVWYEGNQHLEELVIKHLFDVRWREVFILASGTMNKADEFLKRMQRATETPLTDAPEAFQLLRWASSRVAALEDVEQAAFLRAFVLSCTEYITRANVQINAALENKIFRRFTVERDDIHLLTHNLARVSALNFKLKNMLSQSLERPFLIDDNDVLERARFTLYSGNLCSLFSKLDSSQILLKDWHTASTQARLIRSQINKTSSRKEVLEAWRQFLGIFTSALEIPIELLTPRNWESLSSYLYACNLIVDCKNAATRVTRTSWSEVCQQLLNPQERLASGSTHKGRRRKERRA